MDHNQAGRFDQAEHDIHRPETKINELPISLEDDSVHDVGEGARGRGAKHWQRIRMAVALGRKARRASPIAPAAGDGPSPDPDAPDGRECGVEARVEVGDVGVRVGGAVGEVGEAGREGLELGSA